MEIGSGTRCPVHEDLAATGGFHIQTHLPLFSLWLPGTASEVPWPPPAGLPTTGCLINLRAAHCERSRPRRVGGVHHLVGRSRTLVVRSPRAVVIAAHPHLGPHPATSELVAVRRRHWPAAPRSLAKRLSFRLSPSPSPDHVCFCPRCCACRRLQHSRLWSVCHPPVPASGTPADHGPEERSRLPGGHRCCRADQEHVVGWPRWQD